MTTFSRAAALHALLGLGFTILSAFATPNAQASHPPKMVWAHYVGWGMNVVDHYDEAKGIMRFYDRTTLGTHVGTDQGHGSVDRLQILSAMRYGIDGFMIDIIHNHAYASVMGRYYRAAEGLPFKITLCVDGWQGSTDDAVRSMTDFLDAWADHPNNFHIDGRLVIFIYRTGKTPDQCRRIVQGIRDAGYNPYFIVQPQRETTLWNDDKLMDEYLQIFDGLYDFGMNGVPAETIQERLENGKKALARAKKGGILAAGITRGYMGVLSGFYRPPMANRATRENWQAALAVDADWITLTTWNDYIETTHFEPALWARDVPLRINQEYARQWRKEPLFDRPPQVFVTYLDEVMLGNDWTIEVLSLPYTTDRATCEVRLLDYEGNVVRTLPPVHLNSDKISATDHVVHTPGISDSRRLRVQSRIVTHKQNDAEWKELYPVAIRPGIVHSVRPVHMPVSDMLEGAQANVSTSNGKATIRAWFDKWTWLGQAQLVRNGREIDTKPIIKKGPIRTEARFVVPLDSAHHPQDSYIVRFTREDGTIGWSKPVIVKSERWSESSVTLPVIVRGGDFDLTWFNRPWRRSWRLDQPIVRSITLPQGEVYKAIFPMNRPDDHHHLDDNGGWSIAATLGANRSGRSIENARPEWIEETGPQNERRHMLKFAGRQHVTLPTRSLPHFTMTGEAIIRPLSTGRDMYVFSDQNSGFDLGIDAKKRAFVQRQGTRVSSRTVLEDDQWAHIAGVYNGRQLKIYVNGREEGETMLENSVIAINSYPVIGATMREGKPLDMHYIGLMGGFAMSIQPLVPDSFYLLKGDR